MPIEIRPYPHGLGANRNCVMTCTTRPLPTETFTLMSNLPGYHQWEGYTLVFRPTGANVKYIRDSFQDVQWLEGTASHLDQIVSAEIEATRILHMKTGPLPPLKKDQYQYKRLPREHQRRALLLSWNKPAFALLMEQRTGKTKVIIDNCAHLYKLGKLHTLIIVTLNGVHRNWVDNEIPLDLPDWCRRETYFHRGSHTKKQQNRFEVTRDFKKGLRIFAFNVEALSKDGIARDLFEEALGDGKGVMVAIDESSDCIKTYDAKRTKYLIKFGSRAEYRRILTGTQAPEGRPDEVFPQYKFLGDHILGYDTITTFRAHFCVTRKLELGDRERHIVVPGCRHVEELQALIAPHSYRVRRDECMDLPPKIYKRWPVELSPAQRRLYKELRDEFITELDGRSLSAPMAMTRLLRLQQIVCGWFPMEEEDLLAEETWRNIRPIDKMPHNRLAALDDILRTHEGKCLIWARFRPDLEAIQKVLGPRAVSYHGGIKNEQKARNYKAFQNDPEIFYFVANQASAGRGLTLTKATMEVYYSNSFRLVDRTQSEDRPEGDEKKRDSTLIIDLEAAGTIDARIIRRLKSKKDMADLINSDPKSLFLEESDD